jgi:hypothetical protein
MVRPGYGNLAVGDPYRPELYRWALGALTITILLVWYLGLRRRIGPESLAIGALLWPAALGVVSAWLLPEMSYYGSLAAAAAGAGALIAILIRDRRFGWSVVALTAGAVPGTVLLIMGGIRLVGVLGIAKGEAGVFFFVLAGLADTRTAIWASQNRTPDPWTARYARTSNGEAQPPRLLPYGITPSWIGQADVVPIDPPRVDLLGSRSDGGSIEVRARVASSRRDHRGAQ